MYENKKFHLISICIGHTTFDRLRVWEFHFPFPKQFQSITTNFSRFFLFFSLSGWILFWLVVVMVVQYTVEWIYMEELLLRKRHNIIDNIYMKHFLWLLACSDGCQCININIEKCYWLTFVFSSILPFFSLHLLCIEWNICVSEYNLWSYLIMVLSENWLFSPSIKRTQLSFFHLFVASTQQFHGISDIFIICIHYILLMYMCGELNDFCFNIYMSILYLTAFYVTTEPVNKWFLVIK